MVVISSPSCIKARLRHEFTRLPFTCTVHAPHCPWSQPFFVPVRATVSRRQSSSVVRGSMRSWWSLPLMRSVTGTAPAMFGPSALAAAEPLCPAALFACAGAHAAMTAAAAVLPVVRRNARRVGFDGLDVWIVSHRASALGQNAIASILILLRQPPSAETGAPDLSTRVRAPRNCSALRVPGGTSASSSMYVF